MEINPNIEDLLRLMGKNQKTRVDVREKLLKGGKGVFDHLVRAVTTSKNSMIRRNAALILGEMGNKKAVDALIKALEDRVVSVSSNAAIALGMIGDKRAVSPLVRRLHAPAWQIRLNAAISLGWIADRNATGSLLSLLRDGHAYVRRGAAFALGQIGDMKLRDSLIKLLTDPQNPVYEAAVVLASLGDLSGYFYLENSLPQTFLNKSKRKPRKKTTQSLELANLFYSSGLYPAALTEYRRALAFREKISPRIYFSILSNLGNTFRALGQPDQAVIYYLLALRIKPREKVLPDHLRKAETLSDIQELLIDRLKRWISARSSKNPWEPPEELLAYFKSLVKEIKPELSNHLLPHMTLGWKSFYALEALWKEEVPSFNIKPPSQFLFQHAPTCRALYLQEWPFRPIYTLLLRLSDSFLAGAPELDADKLAPTFQEAFVQGYIAGLLQKIWWMSHLRFSYN